MTVKVCLRLPEDSMFRMNDGFSMIPANLVWSHFAAQCLYFAEYSSVVRPNEAETYEFDAKNSCHIYCDMEHLKGKFTVICR